MTRSQQTWIIVGTLVAVAGVFAFIFWPAPDLTGKTPYQRCAYSSWARDHGGTQDECERQAISGYFR